MIQLDGHKVTCLPLPQQTVLYFGQLTNLFFFLLLRFLVFIALTFLKFSRRLLHTSTSATLALVFLSS